jgi:chromosome segregation ATPase
MNFIIKRQERTVEQQAEHDERIARFERSYTAIAELLQRHDSQLVEVTTVSNEARGTIEDLARVAARHDASDVRHDEQIAEMRENINSLTRTVDRYINARGNGSNGSGGAGA